MNVLLVVGIIMLLGVFSERIFKKLNFPQVTGYMIVGLILGESFHGILSGDTNASFRPIIELSLGIIGFMIGAEINLDKFKRYSRSIYTILFSEVLVTFIFVFTTSYLITQKVYMGLMFGALAAATAPAATYSVLKEYKARGPVTTTTLSIVALDDALALLIYGFVSVFAKSLIDHQATSLFQTIGVPLFQFLISISIGLSAGYILHLIVLKVKDRDKILPFVMGTIILVVGSSIHFKVDPILASMVLGFLVSNLQTPENREMFDSIKKASAPIFILFFVLVGARLDARVLKQDGVFLLAIAYILSRNLGKLFGVYLGGKLSNAKNTVTKYVGFCLFDQAGVAVGLSIAAFHSFSSIGSEGAIAGLTIVSIITATTFILQIVAPPMIKFGITRADEVNRNITEEDIIEAHKVGDVMEKYFSVIRINDNLHQIIDIIKKSDDYTFPVVGLNGDFVGIIPLGEIRDTFNEEQMDNLILAEDIVREATEIAYVDQPLSEIVSKFKKTNISYMPVLKSAESKELVGQINSRRLGAYLTKQVLLRQQEIE